VGALWARAKIAALMDQIRTGGNVDDIRPAVVRVALEHHLVSAYTSLVAVDVTPTAVSERLKTAMVRTPPPRNWESSPGSLPQTDIGIEFEVLLGLIALIAAGVVAALGRYSPAARRATDWRLPE
jgi:Ca-activated chloride channel family protein